MKSCVYTASFSCDPTRVWLYLTNPTLGSWRKDVKSAEISDDGMRVVETAPDGSRTEIHFSVKEKPRRMTCTFVHGKVEGNFTAILLGGGDSTSVECTMEIKGLGLFAKPQKLLEQRMEMLRQILSA